MKKREPVVHSSPDIVSGAPVFFGTRVPVRNLFEYLEGGDTIGTFLDDFPTASRKQAVAVLEMASNALMATVGNLEATGRHGSRAKVLAALEDVPGLRSRSERSAAG